MLDLVFKNYTSQKSPGQSFFKNVLETAAQELKLKDKISVSVNLVGEAKIKELNRKYRNKNKPTDVLSFPIFDRDSQKLLRYCATALQAVDLGDIFICLSFAKNEAKRENIRVERKLAQLTAHGFLHLAGYDHEKSEKDAKKMFKVESQILRSLKLKV